MKIIATQDFDAFFEDYVKAIVAEAPSPLPLAEQKFGGATVKWFETESGIYHLSAEGGTIDDRAIGQLLVREQLAGRGFKRASYTLQWDRSDKGLMRQSSWPDIEAKAKRLIDTGKVQILRNGYNTIVGQVEGDHGTYQTEISRDDPQSQAITLWQCECPWDQFAWQRTRQWKKYEGRVCSHVLATYWAAQGMPLDEDITPQPSPFTPNPSAPGGMAGGFPAAIPTGQGPRVFDPNMEPQQAAPGSMAPQPPGQAPEPPELMPEFPGNPALQPAVNPVSVPGLKPQTPLNPVQNAGGTFSSIKLGEGEEFVNGAMVVNKQEEYGQAVGLNPGETIAIPRNSVGEVFGQDPTTKMVQVYFAGPMAERGRMEPHGVMAWFFPNELTLRPDIRPPGPAIRRR